MPLSALTPAPVNMKTRSVADNFSMRCAGPHRPSILLGRITAATVQNYGILLNKCTWDGSGQFRLIPVFSFLRSLQAKEQRRWYNPIFVARRPNVRKEDILSREELHELRLRLASLDINALRNAYHTAHSRCRMVNDKAPSPRSIQELVQAWKQLRTWRSPPPTAAHQQKTTRS